MKTKNNVESETYKSAKLIVKILCIVTILAFLYWIAFWLQTSSPSEAPEGFSSPLGATFEDLLDAICYVESKCEAGMMGDAEPIILKKRVGAVAEVNYRAIGAYQIHKKYVDDCNKILGKKVYTYVDRWDKDKSRKMTEMYIMYYAGIRTNVIYKTNEQWYESMARIHNGGPDGWKSPSTEKYWLKVKDRMAAKFITGEVK